MFLTKRNFVQNSRRVSNSSKIPSGLTPPTDVPKSGELLPGQHRDKLVAVADPALKQVDQQLGIFRCLRGVGLQLLENAYSVMCTLKHRKVLWAERRLSILRYIIDHGRNVARHAPLAMPPLVVSGVNQCPHTTWAFGQENHLDSEAAEVCSLTLQVDVTQG